MWLGLYSVGSGEPLKYLSHVQNDLVCVLGRSFEGGEIMMRGS